MSHTQEAPTSGPLRTARVAVEIVWYVSWALAIVAALGPVVMAIAPGIRTTLVTRGVLTEQAIQVLPFKVRYGSSTSALSVQHQHVGLDVTISPGTSDPAQPAPERQAGPGLRLIGHNDVVLARGITTGLVGASVLFALLSAGIFLWTLHQLRVLLRTVSRGQPFNPDNPVRIRRIGWMVIVYGLVSSLGGFVENAAQLSAVSAAVKQTFPGAFVGFSLDFNLATFIIGLIILAIAQAFEAGVRLQHEQDLTV
jgi:hypothetical protein